MLIQSGRPIFTHLENQVVDVHLLLLLHGANDQAVDVVPLPLQRSRHILVHPQVRLARDQVRGAGPAFLPPGHLLLVEPQDACKGTREHQGAEGERGGGKGCRGGALLCLGVSGGWQLSGPSRPIRGCKA